jgi:protoporphyrinogen oxidase
MLWQAAAAKITAQGGAVKLGCTVTALVRENNRWRVNYHDTSGQTHSLHTDHIISSMPLAALVCAVPNATDAARHAAQALRYRDFLIVALVLRDAHAFDDNWLYIHDPAVKVGRIQNFKTWSPEMVPDPTLACYGMEYFCFEGDGLWTSSDDALIALATAELTRIGLASPSDILRGYVVRQPKAYPVYDHHYEEHVATIRHWLAENCPGLQIVGRNGMHKYNNQDHSMMTALLAAKNILAGTQAYDVWSVNQDAQYHEEASTTGQRLVPTAIG